MCTKCHKSYRLTNHLATTDYYHMFTLYRNIIVV